MELNPLCGPLPASHGRGGVRPQHLKAFVERLLTTKTLLIMKFTAFFLFIAAQQVSAKTNGQPISLQEKNASLQKVFAEIEKQTSYTFVYTDALLQKAKKVDVQIHKANLTEVLALLFKEQPFTYTIVDKVIVVKPKQETSPKEISPNEILQATTIDVSGRVTDNEGKPLAGASVKVKGTTIGTTTDADGVFILKGVDENATLIFSFAEHEGVELQVRGKTSITAALNRTEKGLQEVIINKGYYTEKQKLSTGNVGTVKAADIAKQPVNNPILALQGRIPGIEITQANGLPGSSVKVRIRGQNSFSNGNEPLYIIDGVPYNSQLLPGLGNILGTSAHDLQGNAIYGNPLSFINPSDIESIDVLKDADATAIYGSRAANGAILITTKKGKPGKVKVDINAYTGWGNVTRKIPMLNLRQYLDMRYEAIKNDGASPNPSSDYDLTLWDTTRFTNWQKYFTGGTAQYKNIQTTVSGGNNQVQYLLGAGYSKETTVFPGDFNDTKASVHFNISSSSLNQKFKILLTGSYLVSNNRLLQEDLTRYIALSPNAPKLYNDDGSLNWEYHSNGSATWDLIYQWHQQY